MNAVKLDGIRTAQKDNWQEDVERLSAVIEKDQATIAAQLSRRVFIRVWYVKSQTSVELNNNSIFS